MLSIGVIRNSGAAVSYYEKDDYYTAGDRGDASARGDDGSGGLSEAADALPGEADDNSQGHWWGKGAAALGLAGHVGPEAFREVLEGRLPNGTTLGTTRDGEWTHRPGWDLTFSAPKSVSLAAELGGDRRIVKAHDAAARTALGWLEREAAAYRQRHDGEVGRHASGNLVVALFRHDVSRDQEPQLHTHAVTANATQRADGSWGSLTSEPLFDHKMAAGNVYRAELARSLKDLGYGIRTTHPDGRFELSGMSAEVLRSFSSRRETIEAALRDRGLSGPVAAARAALLTRASKRHVPREVLREQWKALARELGYTPDVPVIAEEARARDAQADGAELRRALREAVSRLAEHEAVFTHADLVRWTLASGMGRIGVADVEREVAGSPEMRRAALDGRTAWTTVAALSRETRLLDALAGGRGAVQPAISADGTFRVKSGEVLDPAQAAAVHLIATTSDRLVGVLGRPGTGKTRMLSTAREVLAGAGYQAVGMATNAEAARVLQRESGIASMTVQRQLGRLAADLHKVQSSRVLGLAERIRADYSRQVWIVDEASQLDARHARRLTTYAERLGARIVLVGDTAQLPAIAAGRPFAQLLEAGMSHVEMDAIRRQQSLEDIAAIRDAIAGDIPGAMRRLRGQMQVEGDRGARLDAIVKHWAALPDAERAVTGVVTARNAERDALNAAMRDVLRREGRLVGEQRHVQLVRSGMARADQRHAASYAPGDVVRFGRAVPALGIARGAYLDVLAGVAEANVVLLATQDADGRHRHVAWNPAEHAGGSINGVEVYRPMDVGVAAGEQIMWTRNDPGRRLTNGQRLTVESVRDGAMSVRTEEGRQVAIDTKRAEGQHWGHGYATTIFKSQGRTMRHTLVNAESDRGELFSQKGFLVAISRHTESIRLFVDDRRRFEGALARTLGEKTSALDGEEQARQASRMQTLRALIGQLPKGERSGKLQGARELQKELSR